MAAKKKPDTAKGYEFIISELKKNKKVAYATIKAAADKMGLTVYPIMYGRAQRQLGLVKASKKKKATARRGPGRPRKIGRRGPGRPRKASSPLDAINVMLSEMKQVERDRDRYRGTLERIARLIDDAL
ncbi:MAG: hypothetical protein QF412_08835 [Planctomycetota bacterium]|jgi:hypothetical protein|nr:hypothetical protein [Planctomycetota bacterium]